MAADDDDDSVADADSDSAIAVSSLAHYSYCPRRCALIHLEQTFDDNVYTLRGQRAHERVDTVGHETRPDRRTEFALPLWSERLGLVGRADVVEFDADGTAYPVEHKVGRHPRQEAEIQLCAQAMCLEEMTGKPVPMGALYSHATRTRREVVFTPALRARVVQVVIAVRAMLAAGVVPPPVNDARCPDCSLIDACLPGVVSKPALAADWLRDLYGPAEPRGGSGDRTKDGV